MSVETAIWTVFETTIHGAKDYEDPIHEVAVGAEFTAPSGKSHQVSAFWDGNGIWRVRFCPDEIGAWRYRVRATDLDEGTDEFECVPYDGDNPLYRHGDIRLSENCRHFVHADGSPFFWMGDTAWNGVLKATEAAWKTYCDDRVAKGFTAIKFVTTQWRAAVSDVDGQVAYEGKERISINPAFFQRMDQYVDALNASGLVAAPVVLWALREGSPGADLPNDQRITLAKYVTSRYGAHQVIFVLGGDGDYQKERAEPWKAVGRAVFGESPRRLVTMHSGGLHWVADEFRHESWYAFNGYQSGHGVLPETFRWICEGPPSQNWRIEPHKPDINLEPNYEGHLSYRTQKLVDDYDVRRAAYWSLLVAPTAGVSYGAHGVWFWSETPEFPLDHAYTGIAQPWHIAIHHTGSGQMRHVRTLFDSLPWWRLLPAPQMVVNQPGSNDPEKYVIASQTDRDDLAVVYFPVGGSVSLHLSGMSMPLRATWFDPREGVFSEPQGVERNEIVRFDAPDTQDWVLILRANHVS